MTPLPSIVSWILRLALPRARAEEIIRDLATDYGARSADRSGTAALGWLTRETMSLVAAFLLAPLQRLVQGGPRWWRDVQLSVRSLRRGFVPALGAAAMLSTGLVALVVTAGLAESLLLRPVSSLHGMSLRRIGATDQQSRQSMRLSFPEVQAVVSHLGDTALVTTVNMQPIVTRARGASLQTMAEVVDGRYFRVVGTTMILGRPLLAADDMANAAPAVVIGEPFWRRHFAGSTEVLAESITVNNQPFTIVGVARGLGSATALGASVDVWVPLAHADAVLNRHWRTDVRNRWFLAFALPAADRAALDTRLAAATTELGRLYPEAWRNRQLISADGRVLTGTQRDTVALLVNVLAGLALLILVTASANIAGVLLARTAALRSQIAIHLSVGSGRAAIVRRHLIEGAIVGAAAATMALALYGWTRSRLTDVTLLPTLSLRLDLPLDLAIVFGVVACGVTAGMLLAIAPALWASRIDLRAALGGGDTRAASSRTVTLARRLLVTAQVGLSFALVAGAGLFGRSLASLIEADLGFPRAGLIAMDFDLEPAGLSESQLARLATEALARAQNVPGVTAAAMSNRAPVDQSTPSLPVRTSATNEAPLADATFYLATEDYFATVGLPLVAGRAFTRAECERGAPLVVVNQALAALLGRDGVVLDQQILLGDAREPARIIGIARDSKYRSLSDAPARPHLYRPTPPAVGLTLLARAADGQSYAALRAIQRALDDVGPGIVGFFPRTLDDHLAIDLLPTRAAVTAASVVGGAALVLSAVALYGLVAWFVELRRREIGVRMALGAGIWSVRRLVAREALTTSIPGLMLGLLLAGGLASAARGALHGIGPLDPLTFAGAAVALAAVVLVASFVPTRRATSVDPAATLR
jgi:predicted permease